MRIFTAFLFGMVLTGVPSYYFFSRESRSPVLAEVVEVTPTLVPTNTPVPPTPTSVPAYVFTSQQINEFIDRFAVRYAVDSNILRYTALCESGFDPLAVNGSYVGLYQFGPITWGIYRNKMGEDADIDLRANAEEAVQTAAYAYSIEKESIWPNCVP